MRVEAEGAFDIDSRAAEYAEGEQASHETTQAEGNTDSAPETIPPEERLTDLGNARRFVRQHQGSIRYCYQLSAWLHFDGKRWIRDESGEIERRAKQTVEDIYAEAAEIADEEERKELRKHAMKSESAGRIASMIDLARSEPGIPVAVEDLDQDPWLLNVENGTIDLRSGVRREHRGRDRITKLAPVSYNPDATCPKFLEFLATIFAEIRALIDFLQRAIGYSLTGLTSEQKLFLLHGGGNNGKTTLEKAIEATLGDYAEATPPETLMIRYGEGGGPSEDIARLRGARFVSSIESEEGRRLAEAKIKLLTGGDKVVARHLYGHYFEFRPTFKLWFATNHLPTVRGQDEAIWRRILRIPFNVTIAKAERVPDFFESVLRPELPGILAWAVAGCLVWQERGLEPPEEVLNATADYRHEQDFVAAFVADCCHVDVQLSARAGALYKAFKSWSEERGEKPMSGSMFGRRLEERGFTKQKDYRGTLRLGLELLDADRSQP